jgi:peptidylprolyl isomerase
VKKKFLAVIAVSALLLTGCGDKKVSAAADNLPTVTTNQGEAPTIGAPTGAAPTTLVTKDIIVGTGAEALPTSTMTVHYTLMAWSTGKVVESSWSGGSPATFPLANVIVGWQKGIPGMKVGGRRLLVIPPDLGYGAQGGGPIGPNETLIFVVDAIGVA